MIDKIVVMISRYLTRKRNLIQCHGNITVVFIYLSAEYTVWHSD